MTFMSVPIVLDAVAKASVILAMTALVTAALRRASASARHFIWTLGLLSALAAPVLSVALPRWELPIVHVRAATPAPNPVEGPAPSRVAGPVDTSSQITTAGGTSITSIPWGAVLLVTWIAGAAVILGRMFLGLAAVLWMSRRTPAVTDAPWLSQARALADSLGLSRVRFLRTGASTMPMAWGIFRSSVLMPADADTWPAHRLRVVLLHELAHVKRRDCLTHLVAQMACAAYWFNPLAWMAARRLRAERERACDDLVLASGTRGSDYADQLLDIARVMRAGRFPAVLAGASLAMARRSQLEGRLMAILDPSVPRRGLTRARAVGAAAVFALLIVPVASVQPWADERSPSPLRADREAGAALAASDVDLPVRPAAQQPQETPASPRPIESYPGQAAADNRRNAKDQDVIQGALQGNIQGHIQGASGRRAGTRIAGAVMSGVVEGITEGIASGIAGGVAGGVARGVAGAVPHEFAVTNDGQSTNDKVREQDSQKGRTRDPRTVNALMEALKDTDKDVRETAMQALVQMRDPRMFDTLVAALKDVSADVREQAAFALGQLRDKKTVEPLISALKDTNPSVREQAAFALGQMRDPRSIEALVIALKDTNADVREQAAFALGQIGDARAIDGLTVALKDSNPSVRQQAAFALGQIR